jgi:hypothetical protein
MAENNALETEFTSLRAEFGEFPVEHDTAELSEESFERVCDLDERGIHGAVRVWVQRDSETLLVRERSRPDSWGVAGGLVEPAEHSNEPGYREVVEAGWFETPPESVHPPATRIGSELLSWNTGESTATGSQ